MKRFHEDSRYYILVDAGGSYIKSIIINREKDIIPDSFSITEIDSLGSQEYILRTITHILENNSIKITEYGTLSGIAFSFPGPFDYQNGISMMEHKYQGILGIRLQKELVSRLKLPKDFPVLFEEDSVAFLKGEVSSGSLEGVERIIGITLGIVIAYLIAFIANSRFNIDWRFVISGVSIAVSLIFALVLGLGFGLYPAKKASVWPHFFSHSFKLLGRYGIS